jgi:hypothetical protein
MNFDLMQYRWYRKWKGGTFYLTDTWITFPFWTDKLIVGCGARIIKTETY